MVSVRPAHPEDLDALARIKREALRGQGVTAEKSWEVSLPNTTRDRWRHSEAAVMVAERDGAIVGWGCLHVEPEPIAVVFIHPTVGPSETGDAIVNRLETIAEAESADTLRLHLY